MTAEAHSGAVVLALTVFLSVAAAQAQQTVARSYPLPDHGSIQFRIPESWQEQIQQAPKNLPPTITWSQKTGAAFRIMVAVGWQGPEADARLTEAELKLRVDRSFQAIQPQAVEKKIKRRELKGPSARGYYFSATDRVPEPGEYKYLTQGIVLVDDLIVAFTIFTNDGQERVAAAALEAIRSAVHRKD
ncbi:MAG: hypothetical protein HY651_08500 [Acidobacteria bacterium]|nr:hypothetical protein [Acidobacteriota bacterium]